MESRITANLKTWERAVRRKIIEAGIDDSPLTSQDVLDVATGALVEAIDFDPPLPILDEFEKRLFVQGIMVEYPVEEILKEEADSSISPDLIRGILNKN